MSVEENKTLIRRYCLMDADEIRKSILEVDEYHAPELVLHGPDGDWDSTQNRRFVEAIVTAFPDGKYHCDDIVADGDKVVARYHFTGTHSGRLLGVAASGKKVNIKGLGIYRMGGGKIVEGWFVSDMMGAMKQMGAIPSPSAKK
jgi:predicted ester cyclase